MNFLISNFSISVFTILNFQFPSFVISCFEYFNFQISSACLQTNDRCSTIKGEQLVVKSKKLRFLIPFIFILLSISQSHSSQYQFLFHHYNDISSYTQTFFLPSYKESRFFFGIDASQNANKNITLSKNEKSSIIKFNMGMRPLHCLIFNLKEKISHNHIETVNIESKIAKNELLFETTYRPKDWIEITPYFLLLSDHYKRTLQATLDIDNSGRGKGIRGILDIKNIGSISSEIGILEQSISNEKKGVIDLSFEKEFSKIIIVGNFEGKNILTQYPVLNGKEEKYLESSKGNIFSEFSLLNRIIAFITYEGSYRNEIYTLLEGYGGKHNNEKRTSHNIATNLSYPVNSRISLDVSIERYNGKKLYQDGLNDELSTVKTFTPSLTFHPNKNSEIKIKRILRLSSFTFPSPLTVTDRDILDKSIFLITRYNLPGGTDVALSLGRTENHIIYIRNEMSANNVCRTKYNVDANINYFLPQRIKIKEFFSLVSNYQIYDFSSNRDLFTRSFAHKSQLTILNLRLFQPTLKYKFNKQDWGSYLYSYEAGHYMFYRNIVTRKESYEIDIEIRPLTYLSIIPSYAFNKNRFEDLSSFSEQSNNEQIEEDYSISMEFKKNNDTLIDFDLTWVKRNEGKNFYEMKARITYGL